jgi:hypothetical protein
MSSRPGDDPFFRQLMANSTHMPAMAVHSSVSTQYSIFSQSSPTTGMSVSIVDAAPSACLLLVSKNCPTLATFVASGFLIIDGTGRRFRCQLRNQNCLSSFFNGGSFLSIFSRSGFRREATCRDALAALTYFLKAGKLALLKLSTVIMAVNSLESDCPHFV